MQIDSQIAAVVVTFNRLDYLQRLVQRLRTVPELTRILIVDNASTDGTGEWLATQQDDRLDYRILPENLGGAGGFQTGLQWSYDLGFELSWLMDDDGLPTADCLAQLLQYRGDYDFWGPAVLAEQDPEKLCFPVRKPGTTQVCRTLSQLRNLQKNGVLEGIVIPFNGVLVTRDLVQRIGTPRAEFFIWGDDVEYLWRALRDGARVATIVDAQFLHPATDDLGTPIMFGKTTYNHSPSDLKHYAMARNNTYNLLTYRSKLHALAFWVKTVWFYTLVRPSFRRLSLSAAGIRAGLRGDFTGHHRFLSATRSRRQAEPDARVAAVVVTYERSAMLDVLFAGLAQATRPVDAVYLIDNSGDKATAEVVARWDTRLPIIHDIPGANLGGAGGFHRGMQLAYAAGYDYLWLMDDDVTPDPDALAVLLADGGKLLACTREDPNGALIELAGKRFDLRNPLRLRPKIDSLCEVYASREQMPARVRIETAAFEGFFVAREVVTKIGLPDPAYFIFYDDCDFQLRAQRAGYEMFALRDALLHRQVFFNQAEALSSWKGYYMYRNLFVVHYRYGRNPLVRLKPLAIAFALQVIYRLRGNKAAAKTVARAFRDAKGMRTLSEQARPDAL